MVEYVDLLKKGTALDLGMGEGRNAIYLASQGLLSPALIIRRQP
ncbi:MAG: hypothetical protein R3A45_01190 [Bdellovibrionota bacterium]